MFIIEKTNGRDALFTPIWYYQNVGQVGQGKEKERKRRRRLPSIKKSFHKTPWSIKRDGKFLFSRGPM
jgi:hypothetical protein